jgi:hypothetical protein
MTGGPISRAPQFSALNWHTSNSKGPLQPTPFSVGYANLAVEASTNSLVGFYFVTDLTQELSLEERIGLWTISIVFYACMVMRSLCCIYFSNAVSASGAGDSCTFPGKYWIAVLTGLLMDVEDLDYGSTGKFSYFAVGPSGCIVMKLSLTML